MGKILRLNDLEMMERELLGVEPSQFLGGLGDAIAKVVEHLPEDDGNIDAQLIARIRTLAEFVHGECGRRRSRYIKELKDESEPRRRLYVIPPDAQLSDAVGEDSLISIPGFIVEELRDVLADIQARVPYVRLSPDQCNVLIGVSSRPLLDDQLARLADIADMLHCEASVRPADTWASNSAHIRAMIVLIRRMQMYAEAISALSISIDGLLAMMSFECKTVSNL